MQTNIFRLRQLLFIAFGLLVMTLVYWQLIRANALTSRNENPRPIVAEQRIQRGNILTANGIFLAKTVIDETGLPQRQYNGPSIAPVVGYSSLRYGTGGLEAAYDATLRGDANVTWLSTLMHQPQIGHSITVTLDLTAQRSAALALAEHSTTGAAIVLNAETGAVRVLASHPTFEPNTLDTDWDSLANDPTAPLLNRVTQGLFPLGDLARLIILVQLAEAETALPDLVMDAPLEQLLANTKHRDLQSTIQQLGFNQAPQFALPTTAGVMPENLPADLEESAITPLHLGLFGAALADEAGQAPVPYLVELPQRSMQVTQLLSPEAAKALRALHQEFTALVPPKITGNEYLSWYMTYTDTSPSHVIVIAITTPDNNQIATRSIAETVLAALVP